jgi:hypothetical protein
MLDLLSQLVNKSLVIVENINDDETRYRRLETIRQYAREKLKESDEEEHCRNRHLKYFLQLSEQAEIQLRGPDQIQWYARLNAERDNVRAALEWANQTDVEAGLYLSGILHRFWESFDIREGSYWLLNFLEKPESYAYPRARAKALHVYGWVLVTWQQFSSAHLPASECLRLYRAVGDQQGEIDGLVLIAMLNPDTTQKIGLIQKALQMAQSLGDVWRQAFALWQLGWFDQGENMFVHWEKSLVLIRSVRDWRWLASAISNPRNSIWMRRMSFVSN